MTQTTNQTQEAERFVELLAELNENRFTGQFRSLSDVALEAAKDLIEQDLERDVYADAIRFNKSRLAGVLTKEAPQSDAPTPAEADDPPHYKEPSEEGRGDLLDGGGPCPLPLSKIAYHRLELWEIADLERAMRQIVGDGGTEEDHASDLAELLTVLSGARTPGELLSMLRHMWYRLAVELSAMREGLLGSFRKTYPPLLKVRPAKARRPRVAATNEAAPPVETEEAGEGITPQRAEEITGAIITLTSGPLPERLSADLHHALDVLASGPAVADTSVNPDMLRVWLPKVLTEKAN